MHLCKWLKGRSVFSPLQNDVTHACMFPLTLQYAFMLPEAQYCIFVTGVYLSMLFLQTKQKSPKQRRKKHLHTESIFSVGSAMGAAKRKKLIR